MPAAVLAEVALVAGAVATTAGIAVAFTAGMGALVGKGVRRMPAVLLGTTVALVVAGCTGLGRNPG